MKTFFLGIDISKDNLDCAVVDKVENVIQSDIQFANNKTGISKLLKWVKKEFKNDVWIGMEHTGHYGYLLTATLAVKYPDFSLINPLEIKRSQGISRGKSDPIDAIRIARYCVIFTNRLTPFSLPDKAILKLQSLIRTRDHLVVGNTRDKNYIKQLKISNSYLSTKEELKELKEQIKLTEQRIEKFEVMIQDVIESNEEIKTAYEKITKVIGVGPITAVKVITETNLFQKFDNPRAFASHCGIAPFPHSSGSSVRGRTRTSKMRNRKLKSVLFNAASSAIQHDPQLRSYYKRKVAEGKKEISVLNAVANKIILRIYAVINRDEPFVKLMA